jgi:hypothetical protein
MLIQEQTPTRNVDSKTCAPRFDYCEPKARRRVLQQNRPIATLPQEFMSAMPPKADKPEST